MTRAELVDLGRSLGAELARGEVVWLEGDLGAGKTTMVQGIAEGLGVEEVPTSPTYNLVHRYESRRGPIYHVDCYRLKQPDEAAQLDWEGLTEGAALLIEWPERAGLWAAPPTRRIELGHAPNPDQRWVAVVQ